MIRQIEKEELRTMHDREGLVLQGCGGDLKEWIDGINQMLEREGILPKGKRLDDVVVFRNEGMTNLLFFFGEEKLDMGKLAARGLSPVISLAAHGCPTMWITGWEAFSMKLWRRSRTVR